MASRLCRDKACGYVVSSKIDDANSCMMVRVGQNWPGSILGVLGLDFMDAMDCDIMGK